MNGALAAALVGDERDDGARFASAEISEAVRAQRAALAELGDARDVDGARVAATSRRRSRQHAIVFRLSRLPTDDRARVGRGERDRARRVRAR